MSLIGVSRTHVTLLTQGKRKLSEKLADKLADVLAGKPNALFKASNPLRAVLTKGLIHLDKINSIP
jgi:hypothetical protein